MLRTILSVSIVLGGAPTFAADAVKASAATGIPDRLICRTTEQTGSRVRKTKSCRTASEWAELKEQTQLKVRDMQRVGIEVRDPPPVFPGANGGTAN